ncbi:MAG TPA: HigA family addiction module antitoxin [Xanthobacteraceae bacterium]
MNNGADHAAPPSGRPEHPGVLLRDHVLPSLGLSVSQAAKDLTITRQTLHRILAGDAAITLAMAARLERLCGVPSEFWLECQHRHELQRVKDELAPVLNGIPSRLLPEAIVKKIGAPHGR